MPTFGGGLFSNFFLFEYSLYLFWIFCNFFYLSPPYKKRLETGPPPKVGILILD